MRVTANNQPIKVTPKKTQEKQGRRSSGWIKVNVANWRVKEIYALAECMGITHRLFLEYQAVFGALQNAEIETGIKGCDAVKMTRAQRRAFAVKFREDNGNSFEITEKRGSRSHLFLPLTNGEARALERLGNAYYKEQSTFRERGAVVALVILQTALLHWADFKKWIFGDQTYAQREGFMESGQSYRTDAIHRLYPESTMPAVKGGVK